MASTLENVALARRWFEEVWGHRNTKIVHELVLPDSICHTEAGDMVGPHSFLEFHARLLQAMPDLRVEVEELVSQGDSVVVRWLLSATHAGKPARFRGMTWIRYANGKMVEGWDCWNVAELTRLLSGGSA